MCNSADKYIKDSQIYMCYLVCSRVIQHPQPIITTLLYIIVPPDMHISTAILYPWNSLCNETKNAPSIKSFKSWYIKYILSSHMHKGCGVF